MGVFTERSMRLPLLGAFALVLVACTTLQSNWQVPAQSPNDPLAYRMLTLENEMQVLLISDPDSPKAAAALDVYVGSGDNPQGRGGLAHFLEHMLFLGTDKYPDSSEYADFIQEHGGSRNAYTSFEHTNYFFDINGKYLPEALDRFAQFFIAPRFDEAYVQREKNAVDSEYQMGLKSDPRRNLDVLQEVMNPAHPYSQFSVGSLESLADRPGSTVRDELLKFYEQYYSANMMRLVVLGPQSLNDLQELVEPMFSPVPNRSLQHDDFEAPLFEQQRLPMMVEIKPQATQRQLQVSFQVDDYRADYRVKPVAYLGNLVGHEGEGSLLSQLKAEGLAERLSAGAGLGWRGGSLFTVNVSLTARGVENYQRVLQLLFAYTELLQEQGAQQWLYDEQSRLAELSFRFREKVEPINYVSALASGMHYYEAQDVLQGPFVMEQYSEQMLDDLFSKLVPENALVVLSDMGATVNTQSEHYQTPYSVREVADASAWKAAPTALAMALPAPNEFIAEDVSLVDVQRRNPGEPEVAYDSKRLKIWFRQDNEFRVPRGATYINFRSPLVGENVGQTAVAILYTAMLKDAVNELSYPALLAGMSFDLYKHAQGISLRVSGYNDKQMVLLDHILAIDAADFDPVRFDNIRKDMIRSLQNSVAKRPSSQVMDDLRESLSYGEWGEQELMAALQGISLDDLQAYTREFWGTAAAEALVFGNYSADSVELLAARLSLVLKDAPAPALQDMQVLKLAPGESLQYVVDVPHDDSVVAWYLQGAGDSWNDRAATALTAQVIQSGFFEQLRTEQQLGYIVSAFSWPRLDVPGLVLLVQSPNTNAVGVADAMQVFLTQVEAGLDEDQFLRHRSALVDEILRPDKNMWERAEFYWQSIAKKQYDFDGRSSMASAVKALSREEWLAYFNRVYIEQRHSLQVVAPGRWAQSPPAQGRSEASAAAIKAGHAVYRVN
jgi:insulysin